MHGRVDAPFRRPYTDSVPIESTVVPVGAQAPDFTLTSIAGQKVSLSSFRGQRHVVLVFLRGFQ